MSTTVAPRIVVLSHTVFTCLCRLELADCKAVKLTKQSLLDVRQVPKMLCNSGVCCGMVMEMERESESGVCFHKNLPSSEAWAFYPKHLS